MTFVNNFTLLLVYSLLTACCNSMNEIAYVDCSSHTVINYDSDSSFFKLPTSINNDKYFVDAKGCNIFLITKTIVSLDSSFGGFNNHNIIEALAYFNTNKDLNEAPKILILYCIRILLNNGGYETVWRWQNYISPNEGGYSAFEVNVTLEASYTWHNDALKEILHILFKTSNYNGGFQLYTMNYTHEDGLWRLLYREKVNTVIAVENEIGYCIDTINRYCQVEGDFFELTLNSLITLDDRICY
jgi:hypothetical protein